MNYEEKIQIFSNAIKGGEILKIIYHGGSQPDTLREILPLQILYEKKQIRAKQYDSKKNITKTFIIDKIDIITNTENITSLKKYKDDYKKITSYKNIIDFYEKNQAILKKQGWIIQYDNNKISLYLFYKNGKTHKTPYISLEYDKYRNELFTDITTGIEYEEQFLKEKPWMLYSQKSYYQSYSKLDNALSKFLKLAEEFAPSKSL